MLVPSDLKIKSEVADLTFAKFALEPLPAGYGHTLGNSLRRVLLSSIPGAAITSVKFAGVSHQFTTIPGVAEDVVDIILNLKTIRFNMVGSEPQVVSLNAKGVGEVTAADLDLPAGLEVINSDQVIATLGSKSAKFEAELMVSPGVGYESAEEHESNKIGVIAIDSLFSPVLTVSYKVEPARIGQKSDFDRLILEITTSGAISPKEALMSASKTLVGFFDRISGGRESVGINGNVETLEEIQMTTNKKKVDGAKDIFVEELGLPTRTTNALKKAEIRNLAELAALSDEELYKIKNLGDKSIEEIKDILKKEGMV